MTTTKVPIECIESPSAGVGVVKGYEEKVNEEKKKEEKAKSVKQCGASMEKCHNLLTNRGVTPKKESRKFLGIGGTRINFSTNQIRNTHLWNGEKVQKNAWW